MFTEFSYGESGKCPVIDPVMFDGVEMRCLDTPAVRLMNGQRAAIQSIGELDFSKQKGKMCHPVSEEGLGWTPVQANEAEELYKQFLILNVLYPGSYLVPNLVIDQFWHAHILDLRKYERETKRIFGQMLYHNPCSDFDGPAEAKAQREGFAETYRLFQLHFGKEIVGSKQDCMCCSKCNNLD